MTQRTIDVFLKRKIFQITKKVLSLTKPLFVIFMIHGGIIDLKDYGSETIRGYRYVLVVIDNFSKLGWTVPLKN